MTEPTPPPFGVNPLQPNVGLPITKMQVDVAIGQLARTIEQWTNQVEQFHLWVDTMPDQLLEEPPFSYSPNDVALLKSATHDLEELALIYRGKQALADARDLGIFARRLAGLLTV